MGWRCEKVKLWNGKAVRNGTRRTCSCHHLTLISRTRVKKWNDNVREQGPTETRRATRVIEGKKLPRLPGVTSASRLFYGTIPIYRFINIDDDTFLLKQQQSPLVKRNPCESAGIGFKFRKRLLITEHATKPTLKPASLLVTL